MRRLSNPTIGVDQGTVTLFSDFQSGGEMWTGAGPRERRISVAFEQPFKVSPAVHISLTMLDIERRYNQRMDLAVDTITAAGFEAVFRTWGDTKIARARASWMAIGELADDDNWDV